MRTKKVKYAYTPKKEDRETPYGVSETIQNETLSISQMFERMATGQPLAKRPGIYMDDPNHDDEDVSKFDGLDLSEQQEQIIEMKEVTSRKNKEEPPKENLEKSKKEEEKDLPEKEGE